MAVLAGDTFTDADGVLLTAHAATSGESWVLNFGASPEILGDRLVHPDDAANISYLNHTPASADYEVQCDFRCLTNLDYIPALHARLDTATNTGYYVTYNASAGRFECNAGGNFLGSYAQALAPGDDIQLKIGCVGTAIVFSFKFLAATSWVAMVSVTDSAYAATGFGALLVRAATTGAGWHADNFKVQQAGTAYNAAIPSSAPAPLLSSFASGNIDATHATVSWASDIAGDTRIDYGTTTAYGSQSALVGTLVTSHQVALAGLTPGTTYHWRARTTSGAGVATLGPDQTFATGAAVATAPVVSNISVVANSPSTIIVTFDTSQPTDAAVRYGPTTGYGTTTPASDAYPGYATHHVVTITGLAPATLYHVQPVAANATGTASNNGVTPDSSATTPTGAPSGAAWLVDDFFGTAGTILSAHSAPRGGGWSPTTGGDVTGLVLTNANRVRGNTNYGLTFFSAATPANPDHEILATIFVASPTTDFALAGKVDPATQGDGWSLQFPAGGNPSLSVNGVGMGGFTYPLSAGQSHDILLQFIGTQCVVKTRLAGTGTWAIQLNVTDANAGAATRAARLGLVGLTFNGGSDVAGLHVDSIYGQDLNSPAIIVPTISSIAVTNPTVNGGTVAVATNTPTTCALDYGTTTAYGKNTTDDTSTTTHSQVIADINPSSGGTLVHYQVTVLSTSGGIARSADQTFTTTQASSGLSPQALILQANYETISVRAPFQLVGSPVGYSAIVEYKRPAEATWRLGHALWLDTRPTVGAINAPNPYVNEARTKIFGLAPNVTYNVRVTFAGPAVQGNPVVAATLATRDATPPAPAARTVNVAASQAAIQAALDAALPGDVIRVASGTVTLTAPLSMNVGGNGGGAWGSGWVRLTSQSGVAADVTLRGDGAITTILAMPSAFCRVDHLTLGYSQRAVIAGGASGKSNWWVDHCNINDWEGDTATGDGSIHAGIAFLVNPKLLTIHNNALRYRLGSPLDTINQRGGSDGIYQKMQPDWGPVGGQSCVFDNVVYGGWDCIGGEVEDSVGGGWGENSDIYRNVCSFNNDDAIQVDGTSLNLATWENVTYHGLVGISSCPDIIGPTFHIRNIIRPTFGNQGYGFPDQEGGVCGFKLGDNSSGQTYIYHTTIHNVKADALQETNGGIANFTMRNNAVYSGRYFIEFGSNPGPFPAVDYSAVQIDQLPDRQRFVKWGGQIYGFYDTYLAGTGMDTHSQLQATLLTTDWTDPTNGDYSLKPGSTLRNAGVVIPGINSQVENPAWNFQGAAPDIGALESTAAGTGLAGTLQAGAATMTGAGLVVTPGPGDTTAPVISNVQASAITTTGATITFTTDELATDIVDYGPTTGYGLTATDATLRTSHSRALGGLSPGTQYHYRIRATDGSGNLRTGPDNVLTTASAADTTPPVISAVVASAITPTGATITWTTDEPATSQVDYGPTTGYGTQSTLDATLTTSHSVTLAGLTAATLYHFRPRSADASANLRLGTDATFTTAAAGGPTITGISPSTVVAGVGGFTLTIDGSGFTGSSVVRVNGSSRTTTYVSATRLTAVILAGDVAAAGVDSVQVV